MAATTFTSKSTTIEADWLNEVDALVWDVFNNKTGAGTSGTILRSNGTNIVNTTATYPATTTANQILYSSATNTISEITTAASSVLVTDSSSVPSLSTTLPDGLTMNARDSLFRVVGSSDATKKLAFEVDGFTTGNTRTITFPDANLTIPAVTAKGDIVAASASGTLTRLAVGGNDALLLPDSGQATGLKWATVNSLTEDTAPDLGADYVMTYDASAATHKRVLAGRLGLTLSTEQATTSGTAITFSSIPSWVKRITVIGVAISTNGTSNMIVQLGDSGGLETSSYNGATWTHTGGTTTTWTSGFLISNTVVAANTNSFKLILTLEDASDFTWGGIVVNHGTAPSGNTGVGYKALSATLDRVALTMANGTDTFDAGSVNIIYEG